MSIATVTTYEWGHRIWLERYTPGEGVEIFAFKNIGQMERAAKALILLLYSTALSGRP